MKPWLGLTWNLSSITGWGVYGLNLVRELHARGTPTPLFLEEVRTADIDPDTRAMLDPYIRFSRQAVPVGVPEGRVARLRGATVLHGLGNDLAISQASRIFEGDGNVGVIFFERAEFSREGLARAAALDGLVAGSSWNRDVLRRHGVEKVEAVFQGVDPALFAPRARQGRFGERFVVFSGGKLDYRKGQDMVLAAFARFRESHADALLVTAWQTVWPEAIPALSASPYLNSLPEVRADRSVAVAPWAARHGIPAESFVDLGFLPNVSMPAILAEADLALFPNRCEGGTNLVAMEAMACGVPCILSRNTGHLDLIGEDTVLVLDRQGPVHREGRLLEDWGESAVDEIVARMEEAHGDREGARRRGRNAALFMRDWSWRQQVSRLFEAIGRLVPDGG